MSNSKHAAPLSVEDIAEAWLDMHLTRVDGANFKAAARVLAIIEPKLQLLVRLQREGGDIRRAIPGDVPAHGNLADDIQYMAEDRRALRAKVEELQTEARIQAIRLDEREQTIKDLRDEREQIRTLLMAAPNEGALTAARRAGACLDRVVALEIELAAAKADGLRVAEEAREAARIALEERRAFQARNVELEAKLADRGPDTERTPIPQAAPKTYFIQDTRQYVGNSVLWWRVDGNGYTCELSDAWEVDEAKARSIERTRDTDKAWPADVVRAAASVHVDMQKLRRVPGDGNVG